MNTPESEAAVPPGSGTDSISVNPCPPTTASAAVGSSVVQNSETPVEESDQSKIQNQNSKIHVASAAVLSDELGQSKIQNQNSKIHRKIAKLPKPLLQLINSMLDDAQPAREIIAKLEASTDPPLPYPISENNLSDWRNSGYQRYLLQQERLALVQANREGARDIIANDDLTTLPEATLQIVANQYYELLADFSPEQLRQQLSEDPLKYTRVLNVFARLVREIVHLRKFRDASAKAAAAQIKLEQKEPDRDLTDNEFDLVVNKWDKVFKVSRRKKSSSSSFSSSSSSSIPDTGPISVNPCPSVVNIPNSQLNS